MSGASDPAAISAPDLPAGSRAGATLTRFLPPIALAVFVLSVGAVLAVAGDTLGYDFRAYYNAASRFLTGQPLYDASAAVAGPAGLFLYPPPFVLLMLPFGLLPMPLATGIWLVLILAAFAVGTAILPTSATVRWTIVLLAGLSWPFVYATKLGQVGAVLYLLFAIGWRWMDRPWALGVSIALGAVVKVQPGLLLLWAALARRWMAAAAIVITLVFLALAAQVVLGFGIWFDFIGLLFRVSDPITTPHNFTPGAVLYQAGLTRDAAAAVQTASTLAAVVLLVWAAWRLPAVPSYLAGVVVSQLISPVAWDHYAMLLLLPTAWLLDRGRRWAVVIPLSTSVLLFGLIPAAAYPLSTWGALLALLAVGWRERGSQTA